MSGRKPYPMTIAELRRHCQLLSSIDVVGTETKTEHLVGRNHMGEVVVQSRPGKLTPARIQQFKNDYQYAVAKGLIKAEPKAEPNEGEE